jgi:DNA-binding transcriptional LysR family regulator
MDRFEVMSTLITVVDYGGFSAASRKLGVPVASNSRKIPNLETLLTTRLLVRTTLKLQLTDSGAVRSRVKAYP